MMKRKQQPPVLAEKLFYHLLPESERQALLGDYAELFQGLVDRRGRIVAGIWYRLQCFMALLSAMMDSMKWSGIMIKNYMRIALRNLSRNRLVSSINLLGLALGMACFMVILLWVQDEMSFDLFHTHADVLWRVAEVQSYSGNPTKVARTPAPLAPALVEEIPEVVNAMRMFPAPSLLVTHGEKRFYEDGVIFASPSILEMFTFPVLEGDGNNVLRNVSSAVITREMAQKFFGDTDPLNKRLSLNNKYDFIVKSVMQNVPKNSQLQFDIILPFEALVTVGPDIGIRWGNVLENWGINFIFTYIQTAEAADRTVIEEKIPDFIENHSGIEGTRLYLQPMKDIHLHSNLMADFEGNGNIMNVRIFTIIAFLILLTACINFMNLTAAQSGKRSKEVGMRKIAGANRIRIIRQFLSEYILLTLLAFFVAAALVTVFLPMLNHISGKSLTLGAMYTAGMLAGLILTIIFTGFLSGIYPAFILSAFRPVQAIRRSLSAGPKGRRFRRILVVFQLMISIALVISTLAIRRQLDFIQNSKLGFDREQVIWLRLSGDSNQHYDSLKSELTRNVHIRGVTAADQLPTQIIYSWNGANWPGKDPDAPGLMNAILVDFDFIETMGIQLADGRAFSDAVQSDRTDAFILNRKAVEIMGEEDPIGKTFSFIGRQGRIIGVVEDFQFETFYHDVKPLVLMHSEPRSDHYMIIRLGDGHIPRNVQIIKEAWKRQIPHYPFDCGFLDEHFDMQYRNEMRMGTLFDYFSILAFCIAFLGLFGLVTFEAERRTKEVGIRKVLGASAINVVSLLNRELLLLIITANIIAWPVAYFLMNRWLQNFAYRTRLSLSIFILSGLTALVIALLTVSYQTIKAATANPVEALRYE